MSLFRLISLSTLICSAMATEFTKSEELSKTDEISLIMFLGIALEDNQGPQERRIYLQDRHDKTAPLRYITIAPKSTDPVLIRTKAKYSGRFWVGTHMLSLDTPNNHHWESWFENPTTSFVFINQNRMRRNKGVCLGGGYCYTKEDWDLENKKKIFPWETIQTLDGSLKIHEIEDLRLMYW